MSRTDRRPGTPPSTRIRARDLGLEIPGTPGPLNAITDVAGIHVGMVTRIEHEARPGRPRPVRTGVTAIVPHGDSDRLMPVQAGFHRFNGNGEMTGTHWIADAGWFAGPVMITNTHAVGRAHHAAIGWMVDRYPDHFAPGRPAWALPVVAETYDGILSDINAQALEEADMRRALDEARSGSVQEGNCGGGTGMIAYGFKGGTGTASRQIRIGGETCMIAALVQANHGLREWLTILGEPVGQRTTVPLDPRERESGSIIVVLASDAPLAPNQLSRVARRGTLGIGRHGTVGGNNSGDIFLAFSTADPGPMPMDAPTHRQARILNDELLDGFYEAVIQCVEEAVLNAMVAADDMGGTGPFDPVVPAIDHEYLRQIATARSER